MKAELPAAQLVLAAAWAVILPLAVHDANDTLSAVITVLAVLTAGWFVPAGRRAHATVAATLAVFLLVRILPPTWAYALPIVGAVVGMFANFSPDGLGFKHASRKARAALSGLVVAAAIVLGCFLTRAVPDIPWGVFPWSANLIGAGIALIACCWFAFVLAVELVNLTLAYAWVAVIVLVLVAGAVHVLRTIPATLGYGLVLVLSLAVYGVLAVLAWQQHRRDAELRLLHWQRNLGPKIMAMVGWDKALEKTPFRHPSDIFTGWPADPFATGARTAVIYPAHWEAKESDRDRVAAQFARVLGAEYVAEDDPSHNRLILTRQAAPFALPKLLQYAELVALARERPLFAPLGVDADGQPFGWNFSPSGGEAHAFLFGPTGAGKSVTVAAIIAGYARQGALVDVVDAKAELQSDYDAIDLPCVRVHKGSEQSLTAFAAFTSEMDRRRGLPIAEQKTLPHWLLVVDETWEFLNCARTAYTGKVQRDDPARRNLARVTRLSRSLNQHLLLCSQMPDVADVGGADVRRMLGFKMALGKLDDADAAKVFTAPVPEAHAFDVKGRALAETPGKLLSVQVAYLEPADVKAAVAPRPVLAFPPDMAEFEADLAEPIRPLSLVKANDVCSDGAASRAHAHMGASNPPNTHANTQESGSPTHTDTQSTHVESAGCNTMLQPDCSGNTQPLPVIGPDDTLMTCLKCGHQWVTRAKAGTSVRCTNPDLFLRCRATRRVPVRK